MSFPIEQVRLNSFFLFTKIGTKNGITKLYIKKKSSFTELFSNKCVFLLFYFTLATIALNASGWFIAKSANTFRLISIPAACKAPIKRE